MTSYYDVLGVAPDAEPEVVAAACRALMKKYHPDIRAAGDSNERARRINEAWETLRDPAKRSRYDTKLGRDEAGKKPDPGSSPKPPPRSQSTAQQTKPPPKSGAAPRPSPAPQPTLVDQHAGAIWLVLLGGFLGILCLLTIYRLGTAIDLQTQAGVPAGRNTEMTNSPIGAQPGFDKSWNASFDKSAHHSCVETATRRGGAAVAVERYCTCVVSQLDKLSVDEKMKLNESPAKLSSAAKACQPRSRGRSAAT